MGDRVITVQDLQQEIERRVASRRPIPEKNALVLEMVTYEALLQRASRQKLAEDPQIRHEINNLLIARLKERDLESRLLKISITDAEIHSYYEKHRARYARPAKARLAILFQETTPGTTAAKTSEIQARLEEARRRILEQPATATSGTHPPGFGVLAIEYSEEQTSRYRGGDIGWVERPTANPLETRWPREVLEAGFALKKGAVSGVIQTTQGLYLVMKTDQRDGSVLPEAEVSGTIRQSLLAAKRRELEERFRQKALDAVAAKINQAAVAAVTLSFPKRLPPEEDASGPPAFPAGKFAERK